MKKNTVRILAIFMAVFTLCMVFASCSGKTKYRDDVAVSAIDEAIRKKVPVADGYYKTDSDYIDFYFKGAKEIVKEYVIEISTDSANINQFGIFHVNDGTAEQMKTLCESYIATMKERWVSQASYIASEHPKMENAAVKVFGNYVVYTMLLPADRDAAFEEVGQLLK